jgi:crotonobetainyl-CoA:carnitine CoA-transferase CaiB-like acyl-CoA transferase
VLDLSRVLAGPWATQLLGDFGADVVKVERPGCGDETRHWGPPWLGGTSGESAYFLSCNRNKRSLTLDLAVAGGQAVARDLALRADVLIENFRSGATARFGLDPETLLREHPPLVYCSISAYDSGSSQSSEPGYDAMIQAAGGFMSVTGPEDGGPQKAGVAIADIMTGMYAASAILAALHSRHRSGRGQHIEVPLFDTQVACLANQNLNYLVGGGVPGRLGTAHPNIVPYQAFATADGDLMLAVGNDRQFRACIASLGAEDRLGDERYATNAMRVRHRGELVPVLAEAFAQRATADWLEVLRQAGVPCGPINSLDKVFASDYAREQQLVRRVRHADDPALPTVANPVRFAETPVNYSQAPPLLGADSDGVLREWLGYSPERIAKLREAGTI